MPSKRQPSKQRRAAQNRAKRDALAARSAHASEPRPEREPKADGNGDSSSAASSTATSPVSEPSGLMGWLGLNQPRQPGQLAVLLSVVFAVAAFVLVPLLIQQKVDDRDEVVPLRFGGLHMAARSALKGETIEAKTTSVIEAIGPLVFLYLALPLLVCIGVFVYFRKNPSSKPLTIGMLVMAGMVILTQGVGIYFMPSLVAMAVGSFQVRKLELPARQEEMRRRREARQKAKEAQLADEDEYEDEDLEDEYTDEAEYDEAEYSDEDDDEYEEDEYSDEDDVEAEYDEEDVDEYEEDDLEEEEPEASDKPDSRS